MIYSDKIKRLLFNAGFDRNATPETYAVHSFITNHGLRYFTQDINLLDGTPPGVGYVITDSDGKHIDGWEFQLYDNKDCCLYATTSKAEEECIKRCLDIIIILNRLGNNTAHGRNNKGDSENELQESNEKPKEARERIAEEEEQMLSTAYALFERFFADLTTGLYNSIANCDGAMYMRSLSHDDTMYNNGKRDAFIEFSNRLQKEFDLVDNNQPRTKEFGLVRDKDIEKMLPEHDIMRCRGYNPNYLMRYRATLADLLESYMVEGFRVGYRFGKTGDANEIRKFNPKELSDTCIETFIHPICKFGQK